MREVRKGSRRGRLGGVGRKARARQSAALEHTGNALRRGYGECAHAVRLGCTPGRRVSRASSDHHVDERLGICAKAYALLDGEGNEAVVGIASESQGSSIFSLL